ncbi:MAG: hypothetical protein RML72_13110 [Bacteroidia bacterium]|nr:hypothetical protein [Bacteroidia bacterium]MDW8159798.1 hypothetical protein [Bacteroidia bacterium]
MKFEEPEVAATPQNSSKNIIIIILSSLLLLIGGGAAYLYFSKEKEIQKAAIKNEDLEKEIQALNEDIKEMEAQLVSSNKEKEEIQKELKLLQDKITYYKVQITKLMEEGKIAKEERDKYKGQLEQLQYYNEKYRQKIQELEEEIKRLAAENVDLKAEVQKKDSANQKLAQENLYKSRKIEEASVLTATDFEVKGVYRSGKIREAEKGPVLKRRKLNILQVCFNIVRNAAATKGPRTLYMVLKDQNGQTLSPVGKIIVEGKEIDYSALTKITYTGDTQPACLEFNAPQDKYLEKGNYAAFIYCSQSNNPTSCYKIGEEYITLQ